MLNVEEPNNAKSEAITEVEKIEELEEKVEDLEDQIDELKHKHGKEIAALKKQHEQELESKNDDAASRLENLVDKEKDGNILTKIETLKVDNMKLEMALKSMKQQLEDEIAFLREENLITEFTMAEAKVRVAELLTELDFYKLKCKKTVKQVVDEESFARRATTA